ncbi:MAG: single-stranded DNA-binding protein [Muribaculaceae bacterium]|nr:single-stranded DNA-binding protein [Muribaculaceae bacterium]
MNKVFLLGHTGTDPSIRYVEHRPVASFTLATNEPPRVLADGTRIPERTEWHNVVMTDEHAEFAEKYIRKGTRLMLEGTLRTRIWEDRTAIKRKVTEVYVLSFEVLGRAGGQ